MREKEKEKKKVPKNPHLIKSTPGNAILQGWRLMTSSSIHRCKSEDARYPSDRIGPDRPQCAVEPPLTFTPKMLTR